MRPEDRTERLDGFPEFLELTAWHDRHGARWEIASRRRLDTRQVVPWFVRDGVLHVGVLERARVSRTLRGDPVLGLEPIGIDFAGVDETGDVLEYGRAIFSARAAVAIDDAALAIPLPSVARSIGYATELALPLLLPVHPPETPHHAVSWDGREHRITFAPLDAVRARLAEQPFDELLGLALDALSPRVPIRLAEDDGAHDFLDRFGDRARDRASLVADASATDDRTLVRGGALRGRDLRFLALHRVHDGREPLEIVTPKSGVSLAMLPVVHAGGHPWFLLWNELRVAALERRARQPIFDLPVSPRYVNATARYLDDAEVTALRESRTLEVAERVLREVLGPRVRVRAAIRLGPAAEPSPSFSSEVRHRVCCTLDPRSLDALPPDVVLIRGDELAAAVRDGALRDPVVVSGLLALGLDPFEDARSGEPRRRRAFLDRMTEGSVVLRRLRSYSSIEREQLRSKTYARVMLKLQHDFGVRIAYPKNEADRGFFKAAFRVFMAAPRGDDDRALQGLHWSHDAFHFALGNLSLPAPASFQRWFEEWFVSGEPAPEAPPLEGPTFDAYAGALKLAEDEATFFSFYTLYDEEPSLARHVPRLTFWQALRSLGVHDREEARAIFDDVTTRATLPERVASSAAYRTRDEVRELFDYMLGFREHHLKDIRRAFRTAARDVYRGFFLRFGIYEGDPARYVEDIRGFDAALRAQPPGLNPLLAATADVRVSIALRVFDVTKAMRLLRAAVAERVDPAGRPDVRRAILALADRSFATLEACDARRRALREAIRDAEISPRNEALFTEIEALAIDVERARRALWDEVERTGLLDGRVVDAERARELPR